MTDFWIDIAYVFVGGFLGGLFAFFFVRMDALWQRVLSSGSGLTVFFGYLKIIDAYYNIIDEGKKALLSSLYIVFFVLAFIFVFIVTCIIIKRQKDIIQLRILDIVIGNTKYIKKYYDMRLKELDKLLNIDEIQKRTQEIQDKETKLVQISASIEEQIRDKVIINLPINNELPVTNMFMRQLNGFIRRMVEFHQHLVSITDMFEKERQGKNIDYVNAYFAAVCLGVNNILFGSSINNVRTHVRYIKNNSYVKLVAIEDKRKVEQDLTPIPIEQGMIHMAEEKSCSLVKSINPEYHYAGKHDRKWKDYITIVLLSDKQSKQTISLGISISELDAYQNLLYLLNYCGIEDLFIKHVERINKKCNIIEVVNHQIGG